MASTMGIGIRQAPKLNSGDNRILALVTWSQGGMAAAGLPVNSGNVARALDAAGFTLDCDQWSQVVLWRVDLVLEKIREQQSGS